MTDITIWRGLLRRTKKRVAHQSRQANTKQTNEVMLWDASNSQMFIKRHPQCMINCRFFTADFFCRQSSTKSQRRIKPKTKSICPSSFLNVQTPAKRTSPPFE